MNHWPLFFLILHLIVVSCSDRKSPDDTSSPTIVSLTGEQIELDTTNGFFSDPYQMFCVDSLLVISNWPTANEIFTLADIKNRKVLKHYGKYGQGPGAFPPEYFPQKSRHARSIEFCSENRVAIIHVDSMLIGSPRYYTFIADRKKELLTRDDIAENKTSYISGLWNINDTLFLADGIFPNGRRLGLCDKEKLVSTHFSYPDSSNGINPALKSAVFFHLFASHPVENLFVSAYRESDWIEICKVHNGRLEIVSSKFTYLPGYKVLDDVRAGALKENRLGNLTLDVTKDFIFVSRSNKTVEESISSNRVGLTGSDIFVYNWKGDEVAQIVLDYPIGAFAVDSEAQCLYGHTSTPYPKLIKYIIPGDILKGEFY